MTKRLYHLTVSARHCWGRTAICAASGGVDMASSYHNERRWKLDGTCCLESTSAQSRGAAVVSR